MVSRLGLLISRAFAKTAPDPLVIAILLTAVTAVLGLLWGDFDLDPSDDGFIVRSIILLDAWRSDEAGFWRFLAFGMQMCLILVTGHALAAAKPVRRLIKLLASVPQTSGGAAMLVSLVACVAGLLNWGLGLIVGALLAREVGRSMHQRGIAVHYPLLAAAGYTTMLLWHGGLSGSAPLSMTTVGGAAKVVDRTVIERIAPPGVSLAPEQTLIGLEQTIGSGLNVFVTGGLLIGVPLLMLLLSPKRPQDMRSIAACGAFHESSLSSDDAAHEDGAQDNALPDQLDRSRVVALLLAVPLLLAIARYVYVSGIGSVGLNTINMLMFALGLLLHGSARAYMSAATDGARGCAGIIMQFPLYGGIMGMMAAAGLVRKMAEAFTAVGNETTLPLLSFISAGIVNLFVPSGGGQWAIQGPIALEAGLEAGVAPATMILAVAYGDQLTNMLQPFWALPLLAITGVRARDIVGYTTVVMMAAMVWIGFALLIW